MVGLIWKLLFLHGTFRKYNPRRSISMVLWCISVPNYKMQNNSVSRLLISETWLKNQVLIPSISTCITPQVTQPICGSLNHLQYTSFSFCWRHKVPTRSYNRWELACILATLRAIKKDLKGKRTKLPEMKYIKVTQLFNFLFNQRPQFDFLH